MAQTQRPAKRSAKKAPAKKTTAKKAPAKRAAVKRAAPAAAVTAPTPEPAPRVETAPAARRDTRRWAWLAVVIVLVLLGSTLLLKLGRQEWGGPPHTNVFLGDGVPATLYLPGEELDRDDIFPQPKPVGERPALIVMAHGYSSDQQGLSTMARSIARAGYATLTFDFRGHGYNRNRFEGNISDDLTTVVDWAETSPYVDPTRIVVLGHSMGAGAGLDFATLDKRVAAVIPVSGGDLANEVWTPPHVLFVVAENDPGQIHDGQEAAAKTLKERPDVDVESVEIKGTDHLSVVNDGRTFDAITGFLDTAFGETAGWSPVDGPRRPAACDRLVYVLVAAALVGFLGRLAGRAVRPLPNTTAPGAWILLAGTSLLAMPLMAVGGYGVLPLGAGQAVAISVGLAAALMWIVRYYARAGVFTGTVAGWVGDGDWMPFRSVGVPGILSGLAIFVLLAPVGVVLHATVPNLERAIYWAILAAALLPFFAAFEAIVRRGGTWAAVGYGVLGRVLLLVLLFVGVAIGALPGVLSLILVPLAFQYILLEIFAATAYATGRNPALIAVVDAIFVAWVAVMFSPVG